MLTCVHSGAKPTLGAPPERTGPGTPGASRRGVGVRFRRAVMSNTSSIRLHQASLEDNQRSTESTVLRHGNAPVTVTARSEFYCC